jgi:hypothetical protein
MHIYIYACMQSIYGCEKMGRINVNVKDSIESKFRQQIFNQKGMKKGNLTQAIEEAMLLWVEKNEDQDEAK